jgi:hypothetical protein
MVALLAMTRSGKSSGRLESSVRFTKPMTSIGLSRSRKKGGEVVNGKGCHLSQSGKTCHILDPRLKKNSSSKYASYLPSSPSLPPSKYALHFPEVAVRIDLDLAGDATGPVRII